MSDARISGSSDPRWLAYKPGGKDVGGLEILMILHQTRRGAIYITSGESLMWDEMEGAGDHWYRSTSDAISLLTPVRMTLKDAAVRLRALNMLAAGLARALEAQSIEKIQGQDFMADARAFIFDRQREVLQIWYLTAASITGLVVIPVLVNLGRTTPGEPHDFLCAASLGALGAAMSVSQRFKTIPIERYTSRLFTAIGGGSRIIYGAAFGTLFLLLQRAGLILQIAAQRPYLLWVAAFIAGFSERAIPELLESIDRQLLSRKTPIGTKPES